MIRCLFVGALCLFAGGAHGQALVTGFEAPAFSGSAAGVGVGGQNGWYIPAAAGSIDFLCHTYEDNARLLADNPAGCGQMIAGRSLGGTSFPRAQRDIDFSSTAEWVLSYDFCCRYDGATPAALNLASFSLNHPTLTSGFKQFIALNNFMNASDPSAGWKAEYNVWNADGFSTPNQSPGAAWTNLVYNRWYRLSTAVNFATNRITRVTITDLTTNATASATPDWYLNGGAAGTLPLPPSIRCFVGGSLGNIAGFDNISVRQADACAADFNGDGQTDFFDYLDFVAAFSAEDPAADFNGDCQVDFFDYLDFVAAYDTCA